MKLFKHGTPIFCTKGNTETHDSIIINSIVEFLAPCAMSNLRLFIANTEGIPGQKTQIRFIVQLKIHKVRYAYRFSRNSLFIIVDSDGKIPLFHKIFRKTYKNPPFLSFLTLSLENLRFPRK